MIARGVFIVVAVAFVLVTSSNVISATSNDITPLFRKVEQAIFGSSEQIQVADTVANVVDQNRHQLDEVLPSDLVIRAFKWIRCSNISIRTSGWKIMEVLANNEYYAKEAVKGGLVDDIWRSIKSATGEEERFIFETLTHLIFYGHWRDNSKFLREKIIPLLKYQVAHENPSIAIAGADSFSHIVKHNDESISKYLFESDVAQVIIEQIGKRSDLTTERDTALLNAVRLMVTHRADLKAKIAKLDFMSRINVSLNRYRDGSYYALMLRSSLFTLSELVENSVEAAELLIEQGLPKLVIEGLWNSDGAVRKEAVMVMFKIIRLSKPKLIDSFRLEGSLSTKLLLDSCYEDIEKDNEVDREKFETVYREFEQQKSNV